MRSRRTASFQKRFAALPPQIQERARDAYRRFREDPKHPGLRFKKIHATESIYSIRIGLGYRAVGILTSDVMLWYWIGSHADYDALVAKR